MFLYTIYDAVCSNPVAEAVYFTVNGSLVVSEYETTCSWPWKPVAVKVFSCEKLEDVPELLKKLYETTFIYENESTNRGRWLFDKLEHVSTWEMKEAELLESALSFDAGPLVHINGKLVENTKKGDIHNLKLEYRGPSCWAVVDGFQSALNKRTKQFDDEPIKNNRTKEYLADHRFYTPAEALDCLKDWRKQELEHYRRWKNGEEKFL